MKSGELHKVIVKSSEARQANLAALEGFLAGEMAQKALRSAGMDPVKVTRAIHLLNDEEIADLAARAAQVQDDFAAGDIGDRTMLYVLLIVGIGTLVAFLIILP
ncbi:MAG: hypothetical protein FJW35_08815 [Acidobacteria bacterium]|nr:hypothetical protein [Acidobacteriota bacterium]